MPTDSRVHTVEDYIEIPALTHGDNIYYRVCYGNVNWGMGQEPHKAIFIVMNYDGRVSFQTVAHLITTPVSPNSLSEFDQVIAAIQKLRIKYEI